MKPVKTRTLLASLPLFAAALLTVTACSHDTEPNPANDGRVALSVTSGIQTRAYDKTWESGDAIGIYLFNGGTTTVTDGAANRKYTTTDGEDGAFAPAASDQTIYFPMSENTQYDLVAYYPHATIGTDNLYPVDVTTQTPQKAIDLMGAAKVENKNKNNASVAFLFAHKLAKLDIVFKGDGTSIIDDQLANTAVKITNQQTAATYNVVDGGAVTVTSGTATEITLLTTDLKAEGIVLPNASTDGMNLTFTVPALSQTFSWEIKNAEKSKLFEAGKKYKYTITIGKAGLSVSSTVTPWAAGNGDNGETGNAE